MGPVVPFHNITAGSVIKTFRISHTRVRQNRVREKVENNERAKHGFHNWDCLQTYLVSKSLCDC